MPEGMGLRDLAIFGRIGSQSELHVRGTVCSVHHGVPTVDGGVFCKV